MGECFSRSQDGSMMRRYFQEDIEIDAKAQVYSPLMTTLFNVFRKRKDLVVVQPSAGITSPLTVNTIANNVETMDSKTMKSIFNLKRVVVIGSETVMPIVTKIITEASINKVYVISQSTCQEFLKKNPLFQAKCQQLEPNLIPILVFDSNELIKDAKKKQRVFIHLSDLQNNAVYLGLGLFESAIIRAPQNKSTAISYYRACLKKSTNSSILLSHTSDFSQTDLLDILAGYLNSTYGVSEVMGKIYLQKWLPNATVDTTHMLPRISTKNIITDSTDRYNKLLMDFHKSTSPEQTERIYNFLQKLVVNIYSNPDKEDEFRTVKATNVNIAEIVKHSSGQKLMEELGFHKDEEKWVNSMETKYLKLHKVDLEVGFRKYKLELIAKD